MSLDYLTEEKQEVNEDALDTLSRLSLKQLTMEGDVNEEVYSKIINAIDSRYDDVSIETLEKVVKYQKEKLRKISQELIPEILNRYMMKDITLKTGHKITVRDKIKASITKNNFKIATENMINNESEVKGITKEQAETIIKDMIKKECKIDGQEENLKLLLRSGIPFDLKESIHYATLNSYCEKLIQSGSKIPFGISTFQYQETKIKKGK